MAEDKCGIMGCDKSAIRSYAREACERAGLDVKDEEARRVHLCREHNKQYKKSTRTERKLETLGR
ncbi:MAG: hypothetical protein GX369_04190 [Euryarchaeota archaeon]|nr:hypothetical protein [Euryarchaeota archaeon]